MYLPTATAASGTSSYMHTAWFLTKSLVRRKPFGEERAVTAHSALSTRSHYIARAEAHPLSSMVKSVLPDWGITIRFPRLHVLEAVQSGSHALILTYSCAIFVVYGPTHNTKTRESHNLALDVVSATSGCGCVTFRLEARVTL